MFILFAVFWFPAIGLLVLLLVEYSEIRSFFKNSKQTTGKVVGIIGAQYKKVDSIFTATLSKSRLGGELLPQQSGKEMGGALLLVEYEHENGNSYQVRSKQSFNKVETEQVRVDYNPENASDVVIDGYYANTAYLPRLVGIIILFGIPIVIKMLSK
ncbi:MAG: hypothetical protein ACJAWV_000003 [Flammeovirgaceae bacterium]|jgi:hypothetical protein